MRPSTPACAMRLIAAVVAAAAGCALPPRSGDTLPGPVHVRVGKIDAAKLEASLTDVPAGVSPKMETLFDLFWEAGCAGDRLELSPRSRDDYPDVVCTLPGRSGDSILVVAHAGGEGVDDDWASAASLPHLYRALARDQRAHTFVFAGLGQRSPDGAVLRSAQDLAETLGANAVVNLRGLGIASEILWCLSSDASLRNSFANVGLGLGRPLASLRLFTPPAESQPSMSRPPMVAIGRLAPEGRGQPDVGASGESLDLVAALRVIAVYLGYIDQVLVPGAETPPAGGGPGRVRSP